MKIVSCYNYKHEDMNGFLNQEPSQTIQDDSLTIQQMFQSLQFGDNSSYRPGMYDDDANLDREDPTYLDELDIADQVKAAKESVFNSAKNDAAEAEYNKSLEQIVTEVTPTE